MAFQSWGWFIDLIMIVGNRLNSWLWISGNKGFGRKDAIFGDHDCKKYIRICDHDHMLTWRECETPFKSHKQFHFIPNLIITFSSFPPSFPTLKKDLIPLIFSLKFLQKFLKIGYNASGNNLGARFFMVKPIGRRWLIVNSKGILEDLPFPSPTR